MMRSLHKLKHGHMCPSDTVGVDTCVAPAVRGLRNWMIDITMKKELLLAVSIHKKVQSETFNSIFPNIYTT